MKVNFITEITGFYRFIQTRQLSRNAQLLWFHLFCLWNSAGFPDWLQVDMIRMMAMIQVSSRGTADRARNELIAAGRLIYQRSENRLPNKYQFVLFDDQTTPKLKNEPTIGHQTGHQTGHLSKPNETKVKKETTSYGQFGNVRLSDAEYALLQQDFPDNWAEWIRRLDVGKESRGYVYSNDYAAIHSWKDKEDGELRDQAFQQLLDEWELLSG